MNVLITGCSRGIGSGLTQQFLERTNAKVIATSRDPESSEGLQNLLKQYGEERLLLPRLDILDEESFSTLKEELKSNGVNTIDIILGNAGIAPNIEGHNTVLNCTTEEMLGAFYTNVLGNMRLLKAFHDMLSQSAVRFAVMMSSSHGSLTFACSSEGSPAAYRCSKTALNMMSVLYAVDPVVRESGIKVVIFHPGRWVKTDMGYAGGPAKTEIEESATGLLELIERAVHLQIAQLSEAKKLDTSVTSNYEFKHSAEEIESKGHLDRFAQYLQNDNFAYVNFDGTMMEW